MNFTGFEQLFSKTKNVRAWWYLVAPYESTPGKCHFFSQKGQRTLSKARTVSLTDRKLRCKGFLLHSVHIFNDLHVKSC